MSYSKAAKEAENMFRQMIRNRMEEKKMTFLELAERSGVHRATLHRWLNEGKKAQLETFLKICGALEIRPYFEMSEEDDRGFFRHHFN